MENNEKQVIIEFGKDKKGLETVSISIGKEVKAPELTVILFQILEDISKEFDLSKKEMENFYKDYKKTATKVVEEMREANKKMEEKNE